MNFLHATASKAEGQDVLQILDSRSPMVHYFNVNVMSKHEQSNGEFLEAWNEELRQKGMLAKEDTWSSKPLWDGPLRDIPLTPERIERIKALDQIIREQRSGEQPEGLKGSAPVEMVSRDTWHDMYAAMESTDNI